MKRIVLDTKLYNWEGQPIYKDSESSEQATVRDILLRYLRNENLMSLSESERDRVYELGVKIGANKVEIVLESRAYDTLKKIAEGKIKSQRGSGSEDYLYASEIRDQVRMLVDNAENVEEAEK